MSVATLASHPFPGFVSCLHVYNSLRFFWFVYYEGRHEQDWTERIDKCLMFCILGEIVLLSILLSLLSIFTARTSNLKERFLFISVFFSDFDLGDFC
mmetsp:Transcript_54220/g.62091  ORF Transcript_54220/g.62091 Transcript_54220/m.62091 type:complete len:97 (+) Transcript_54220:594-884(+)